MSGDDYDKTYQGQIRILSAHIHDLANTLMPYPERFLRWLISLGKKQT